MRTGRSSKTAEQVAFVRAFATLDGPADRICNDPMALSYLGPPLRAYLQTLRPAAARNLASVLFRLSSFAGSGLYVPARVAFIDEALLRRVAQGLNQLVLLGAGFDSRAERFAGDLKGVQVFEVDFPATQERKLRMRPAAKGVEYLAIDLAREAFEPRLVQAGFDPKARSAFIWEGVIYYLTRPQGAAVLDSIRSLLQPGGGLIMDYGLETPQLGFPQREMLGASLAMLRVLGEPVHTRFRPEEVAPFFEAHGFSIADRAETLELQRRYFRGRYEGVRLLPVWGCLDLTAK